MLFPAACYPLHAETAQAMEGHPGNWPALHSKSVRDNGALLGTDSSSRTTGHVQELFHEDAQVSQAQGQPWWKVQLFVWEPVLFGTWDGVLTTCMINIFGVVLFLRTGWLVGNTDVLLGMLLVSLVVMVALVTVFSGIGVCERCRVGSGGVYSMISTVLGGRVGGKSVFSTSLDSVSPSLAGLSMSPVVAVLQCVAGAMYITGFAESIAEVLNLSNIWAVQGISMGVLLGLLGINLAGVKWIIRLQLLLLAVLAVSALDFVVGTFSHLDPVHGFVGYSEELLRNNTLPDYTPGESFFSVFGVFFPAATGVMAGFNMSGDLQKPAINIPVGSLAAIGISWFLYLVFVFLLGAICTREALRYDFLIAEKVSLVGFLFLLWLYISSLASCMGGLYGAPRILQCIAQEKVIPILGVLGQGRGPNKTPVAAICLTSLITMAFIFIGQVNVLASIVTINFMLTYSTIDYSYFCVSMSYDLQMKQRRPLPKEESRTRNPSKPLIFGRHSDYGTDGMAKNRRNGTLLEFTKDMDQIFQTVDPDMENKEQEREKKEKESKSWRTRKLAKQTLMDSFRLDLERSAASVKECAKTSDTESVNCSEAGAAANSAQEEQDLMAQAFDSQEQQPVCVVLESDPRNDKAESAFQRQSSRDRDDSQEDFTAEQRLQRTEIQEKPISFYSRLCNHWVSLVGAISSLMIMFVIQWIYAFVNIGMAILLYFYIGKVSPGLPPGVAAHFSFFKWIQSSLKNIGRRGPTPQEQIVMTPSFATVGMETTQLTEENADFASRDRYHHSSIISAEELNHPLH